MTCLIFDCQNYVLNSIVTQYHLFLNLFYSQQTSHQNRKRPMLFESIKKEIRKNCKIIGPCSYYQYMARVLRDYDTERLNYNNVFKHLINNNLFLDISKVFDTVWHEGLIFELKQNGIYGNLLNVIIDFLNSKR